MLKTNFKMKAHPIRSLDVNFRKSYLKGLAKVILQDNPVCENDLMILKVLINTLDLEQSFLKECLKFKDSSDKAEIEDVKRVLKSDVARIPFLIDSFLIGYCNNGLSEEGQNIVETLIKMFDCSEVFYGLGKNLTKIGEEKVAEIFVQNEEA